MDGDRHAVLIMQGRIKPTPSNSWVNLVLFLLTVLSVHYTGASYELQGSAPVSLVEYILKGLPYTLSLLGILTAHEFGHYLAARYHKLSVTLPYFIPLPFLSILGTMGAAIQLKEPPKNKRILLDVGIAGPIAGLLIAIPVTLYGLSQSVVNPLPATAIPGTALEGNSILYILMKYLVFGQFLPTPPAPSPISGWLFALSYVFLGQPVPWGGQDVMLNSVAWAGWAGLLVTALNLIPAGQLDGGHVVYVLLGEKARKLWPYILGAVIILGLIWSGWWLWALLIFLLGRVYAEPLDQITALDGRRKALAMFGLVLFVMVFMPVPLQMF
jgi:membrane-associated protease RseP (regulator of RpoE activity)